MKIFTVGVLSIQGAVSEHVDSLGLAFKEMNIDGEIRLVKTAKDIEEINAIIIPGGESTTISKILLGSGMHHTLRERIEENSISIMGTCAGCILLAKEIIGNGNIELLKAMDMQVERNAFGRQRESFERSIKIKVLSEPYNAVFIRAPIITKTWGECEVIGEFEGNIVAAKQGNYLALSFHPELTQDIRIHKYFLENIKK